MWYRDFTIQLVLLFFVVFTPPVRAVELLINQRGFYRLGDTISSFPAAADSIINITVSDVVLDLGGYTISQGNATASVDGILINNGLSDIVIRNGTISNVTRSGIRIGSSCSQITIQNVEFLNCRVSGVDFQGTAGSRVVDGAVTNCQFYNCATTAGGAPINMLSCANFSVNNCTIANASATIAWTGALLNTSSQCSFNSLTIKSNTTTNALTGISVIGGSSNSFTNCLIQNNSGSTALTGVSLTTATTANSLIDSTVAGNTSSAGLCIGFSLNNAPTTYFNNCSANGNTGVGARGFVFDGGSNNVAVIGCTANGNANSDAASSAVGFQILTASNGLLLDCVSAYNTSALISQGIAFGGLTPGATWTLRSPLAERNLGNSAANSFGLFVSALTPGAFFYRTIGFNNNTTAANQISAPAAYSGSITNPAAPPTSNMNGIIGAWENLAIQN